MRTAGAPPRCDNDGAEPVDDPLVVLDLLYKRWGDCSSREINRWFDAPFVEIGHHHDFSDSSYHRFLITERVADDLKTRGLVAGKPQWGYTDDRILSATSAGISMIVDVRRAVNAADWMRAEEWLSRRYR